MITAPTVRPCEWNSERITPPFLLRRSARSVRIRVARLPPKPGRDQPEPASAAIFIYDTDVDRWSHDTLRWRRTTLAASGGCSLRDGCASSDTRRGGRHQGRLPCRSLLPTLSPAAAGRRVLRDGLGRVRKTRRSPCGSLRRGNKELEEDRMNAPPAPRTQSSATRNLRLRIPSNRAMAGRGFSQCAGRCVLVGRDFSELVPGGARYRSVDDLRISPALGVIEEKTGGAMNLSAFHSMGL